MILVLLAAVVLVVAGVGWYLVQRRRLNAEASVSPRWLNEHAYERDGDLE